MKWVLVVLVSAISGSVCAQNSDAEMAVTSARSVTRFTAVKNFCPSRIPTDAAYADKMADAFAFMGQKAIPLKEWSKLLLSEAKRRRAEVSVTGEQEWCENQRSRMEELGDYKMFPRGR